MSLQTPNPVQRFINLIVVAVKLIASSPDLASMHVMSAFQFILDVFQFFSQILLLFHRFCSDLDLLLASFLKVFHIDSEQLLLVANFILLLLSL